MERRRRAGVTQPDLTVPTDQKQIKEEKTHENQVQKLRSHKRVTYAESSPPTPRTTSSTFFNNSTNSLHSESVEDLKPNRHSVPDFRQRSLSNQQIMLRHRSSCLEEIIKLQEAHGNKKYPANSKGIDKNRSTSLYVTKSRTNNHVIDENGNHEHPGTWNGIITSSPIKSDAAKTVGIDVVTTRPLSPRDEIDGFSEEDQKQQTLLMKRRNSLRLQKDDVGRKVKVLKGILDQNKKISSMDNDKKLSVLQDKLSVINSELEEINIKIDIPEDAMLMDTKKASKKQLFKFKSTQKSSSNAKERTLPKENLEALLTSPGLSPRLRKRSLSKNLKMLGTNWKRSSESSEPNSHRGSSSSVESSFDTLTTARDIAGRSTGDISELDFPEVLSPVAGNDVNGGNCISPVPLESDEKDGDIRPKSSLDQEISQDALFQIEVNL